MPRQPKNSNPPPAAANGGHFGEDTAQLFAELDQLELVEEDKINMDSAWHRLAMGLLIESVSYHFRDRQDFYVGGNQFIYFSAAQVRNKDFRGPDFFYVNGVSRTPLRPYWVVWREGGRYPDLIVELTSPSTEDEDHGIKKRVYEKTFHTLEYYCFDPLTNKLEGWRLGPKSRYRPIEAEENGWMWSDELDLWLGTWSGQYQGNEGVWLRFYDAEGQLVLIGNEDQQRELKEQKTRADALAAEIERLKAQLKSEKKKGKAP